tara:strand:+ start:489 stop:704 length:216 start_codon:yes stop_codon:yes gene_type:complete
MVEPMKRSLPSYEGYDQILSRVKGIIKEKIGSSDLLDKALMKCLLEVEDLETEISETLSGRSEFFDNNEEH